MKCLDMKNFVKERDEALLSLDKDKIMAYAKKYQVSLPKNEKVFWAGIHKARLGVKSFSEEAKQISAEWLVNNGFKPFLYPKESEGVSE